MAIWGGSEHVKLLWILSERPKSASRQMIDKLTQTSGFVNNHRLEGITRGSRGVVGAKCHFHSTGYRNSRVRSNVSL
jgi:hypothetical protein